MIVRLMGEGQWRIDESVRQRLNELDEESLTALERGDEAALDAKLEQMWALVKSEGEQLPPEDLPPRTSSSRRRISPSRRRVSSSKAKGSFPISRREIGRPSDPASAAGCGGRDRGREDRMRPPRSQSSHGTASLAPGRRPRRSPRGRHDRALGGRSTRRSRVYPHSRVNAQRSRATTAARRTGRASGRGPPRREVLSRAWP